MELKPDVQIPLLKSHPCISAIDRILDVMNNRHLQGSDFKSSLTKIRVCSPFIHKTSYLLNHLAWAEKDSEDLEVSYSEHYNYYLKSLQEIRSKLLAE